MKPILTESGIWVQNFVNFVEHRTIKFKLYPTQFLDTYLNILRFTPNFMHAVQDKTRRQKWGKLLPSLFILFFFHLFHF